MEGVARRRPWKDLKQRLALKGISLCGSSWSLSPSNMNPREDARDQEEEPIMGGGGGVGQIPVELSSAPPSMGQIPVPAYSGINLATALAEERNQRSVGPTVTPLRSLMRLFDETDGVDGEKWNKKDKEGGIDAVCCVCIERNKGAAFIPCGHTFCRVCSRELLLNRGSCPLCNRSINEILDLF